MNQTLAVVVLVVFAQGLAGCDSRAVSPSAPSQVAPPRAPETPSTVGLKIFTDPRSGFSTSEVRDANDRVVQFNTANELIWSDGTRLGGYFVQGNSIPAEAACGCWLVVRFGERAGDPRAYMTADYGHDNPGTVVALDIAGGALVVKRTTMFVPGTHTLSGIVTELIDSQPRPLANAGVWVINEEGTGWRVGTTDTNGFYEIRGLAAGSKNRNMSIIKDGYETVRTLILIEGDTRFDSELVRR